MVNKLRVLLQRIPRRWLRAAGALLAVLTTAFVVVAVVRQWDDIAAIARDADPVWLVGSVLVYGLAEVAYACAWPVTLRRADVAVPTVPAAATFLVTQTAKFVPGSIWQHVGRLGASDRLGAPKRVVAATLVIETAASVAAALFIAAVMGTAAPLVVDEVGPWLRALELAGGLVAIILIPLAARRAAQRVAGRSLLAGRALVPIVAWHVAVWATYGVAAGLLAVGLGAPFRPTIGAFTLSWVAGLVVVGAPAGLGVREAVMAAALTPSAGADAALAVTVGSRVVWTVVQLAAAAAALPYVAHRRRLTLRHRSPCVHHPFT